MKALFKGQMARKFGVVLAGMLALVLMQSAASAATGIRATRHNLGASNEIVGGTPNKFTGTAEVCVFCHTPHGSALGASVPLWNRTLPSTTSYTRYSTVGTATFDAAEAPIGSTSIACLSCHDGSQAMNVVINTPGSGTTTTMAGTWTGSNVVNGNETVGGFMTESSGGAFPKLGTDLRNDHPVSMQYGGGGISDSALAGATVDPDFIQAGTGVDKVNSRTLGTGTRVWWVETGGNSTQSKTDLTLYSRADNTQGTWTGVNQPFVECATCHDPHSENPTFLRVTNANSTLCLSCHVK